MILIPEQVKEIRDELKHLTDKKKDYEEYFKNMDKTTMDLGFVKHIDTTLESDDYNTICKKIESYERALIDNEFIEVEDDDTIGYGREFTVYFDDTEEEETYTLVENLIGLTRANINNDNGYIAGDTKIGMALIGKRVNDNFSYTLNIKGSKNSLTITGKVINIISNSNKKIHFLLSKDKSKKISKRKKASETLEITMSQYQLLQEEKARLNRYLAKNTNQSDKISVNSTITLKDCTGKIKKYKIVDKDKVDVHKEIKLSSKLASKLMTRKLGDSISYSYSYIENGKSRTTTYTGTIIEIDNEFVSDDCSNLITRLNNVDEMLNNSKIVKPKEDGKVDIGSKVSIITFEDRKVQNRRVELIKQAVSTELNTDYILASSPLGKSILGLNDNEMFTYKYYSYEYNKNITGNGAVYDINNNIEEDLAKDPLTYQKKKRG